MKIVYIIPSFLPDTVAGTEIYCLSLCKYMQEQGVEVEVVTPGYGQQTTTEYNYDGIRVVKYAEPTVQTRLHIAGLAEPEGLGAFSAYLQQARPDLVHFHGIYGGIGITVGHMEEARRLGFTTIYTVHIPGDTCRTQTMAYKDRELCDGIIRPRRCAACSLFYQKNNEGMAELIASLSLGLQKAGIDTGTWGNALGTGLSSVNRIVGIQKNLKRLAASCDKMIFCAEWYRKIVIANGFPAEKTEFIPTALSDTGKTDQTTPPLPFNSDSSFKLILIGRIHPGKGVGLLLEALQGLPEEKIELSIFGKADNNEYYLDCLKLTKGRNNIHWRGLIPRDEVLPAFRQHDMLCLPSVSEMSSLVIQEAFAAGLPVLASNVYGNAEQVRHGENGLLFSFKSVDALRHQLSRLIGDKDLLPALRSNVIAPPSFDKVGEQYLSLYEDIIDR